MVDLIAVLALFIMAMVLDYKCERLENKCNRLESECRNLEFKTNLMDLKYIDRKDLIDEFKYRKSIEEFRKSCEKFQEQCQEINKKNNIKEGE